MNGRKRNWIAFLTALVMVVGGLVVLVLPGGMASAVAVEKDIENWNDLKTEIERLKNGDEGIFTITKDIETNANNNPNYIEIKKGTKVTIQGKTGNEIIERADGYGSNFFWVNEGELILQKITLDGNDNGDKDVRSFLGIVKSDASIVTLGKGSVLENMKSKVITPGAIDNGGTLYINGGIIRNNEVDHNKATSGGIYNVGTIYFNDGEISGNKTTGSEKNAGAINNDSGVLYLNGGTIKNNEAADGTNNVGGIFNTSDGSIIITAGEISDNTCAGDNGQQIFSYGGNIEVSGGTISGGNKAVLLADYFDEKSKLYISGSPNISNLYFSNELPLNESIFINGPITGGSIIIEGSDIATNQMAADIEIAVKGDSAADTVINSTAAEIFRGAGNLGGALVGGKIVWKTFPYIDDLQAAIDSTTSLVASTYTAASWQAMQNALAAANSIKTDVTGNNPTKTQKDIADATAALEAAVNALAIKPSQPARTQAPAATQTPTPTTTPTATPEQTPEPTTAATQTPVPSTTPNLTTPTPSIPQGTPAPKTGWSQTEGKPPKYTNPDGTPAKGWVLLTPPGGGAHVWYYFGDDGYAITGWLKDGKNADGSDRWFYLFPAEGGSAKRPAYSLAVGWFKLHWRGSDNWYYFKSNGVMHTGWLKQGKNADGTDRWYYLKPFRLGNQPLGSMATGWVKIMYKGKPTWFYFSESGSNIGVMQTGWVYWNGHWYYLDENGAMVTGWRQIMYNGKLTLFYFEPNVGAAQPQGSMHTNPPSTNKRQ